MRRWRRARSALFRLLLEQEALDLAVAELPLPTTTTDGSGGFVLWLDSVLVGEAASYDIDVTPPLFSGAPELELRGRGGGAVGGRDSRPRGAQPARAVVCPRGGDGSRRGWWCRTRAGVYHCPPDDYCARQPSIAGGECEPTAKLRGTWRSDELGNIRVVLPDP